MVASMAPAMDGTSFTHRDGDENDRGAVIATTTTTTPAAVDDAEVDASLFDKWVDKPQEESATVYRDILVRHKPKTELEQLMSREAFASRLQTFGPLTYFCKPTSLSPIVCARFG